MGRDMSRPTPTRHAASLRPVKCPNFNGFAASRPCRTGDSNAGQRPALQLLIDRRCRRRSIVARVRVKRCPAG